LLGAIDHAGSATPYELKRIVAQRVGPLFELAHSQYYDETARLARAGFLLETQEDEGRRRLVYALTDEGRRTLLRWLRVPEFSPPEFRDLGLLKLAFSGALDPDEVGNLARDQAASAADLVDAVAMATAEDDCGPAAALNLALAKAMAAFWADLAASLPVRAGFVDA
jgi:DNA-binding PadR family transcriptional regulator